MKMGQKSVENCQNTPLGAFWGFDQKKFFFKKFQLINISLFRDKSFVVRPTSDPKKIIIMKICQKIVENRLNTPLGAFMGVQPKKKFSKSFNSKI